MEIFNLCYETHTCVDCKEECLCRTYVWACPWRNNDEDRLCGACLEKTKTEMETWEDEQERIRDLV